MDPLTHAASGAMLAIACRPTARACGSSNRLLGAVGSTPGGVWAVLVAALVSASPDVDVFFSTTPVGYLLFHRGITHSLAAVPVLGFVAALLMFVYWRRGTSRSRGTWSFGQTWILAMMLLLLHIWLDCVTTYGTMIFLPFSEYRVRLNGIFIVDALLLLPLLAGLWFARRRRWLAALLVLWTLAYPAACVGLRMQHEKNAVARLQQEGVQAARLTVLPDALAPLFWRVLYETDTPYTAPPGGTADSQGFIAASAPRSVHQQGLDWRGLPATAVRRYPAAEASLVSSLRAASFHADVFFRFTLMPLQEQRPLLSPEEYRFYDLRFGTMLPFVEKIMQERSGGGIPFALLARGQEGDWTAERMVFSGANRSSPWQAPAPPQKPAWPDWLAGWR